MFSLGRKNNILIKKRKKVCTIWTLLQLQCSYWPVHSLAYFVCSEMGYQSWGVLPYSTPPPPQGINFCSSTWNRCEVRVWKSLLRYWNRVRIWRFGGLPHLKYRLVFPPSKANHTINCSSFYVHVAAGSCNWLVNQTWQLTTCFILGTVWPDT